MYTVYVIKNRDGKLYKGVSNNIVRRLKEHQGGHTRSTRNGREWKVVYKEEYDTFDTARNREKYFKTAAGRRFLEKILPS